MSIHQVAYEAIMAVLFPEFNKPGNRGHLVWLRTDGTRS